MIVTIYKYPINDLEISISLPVGARFLTLRTQHGKANLWFLINPQEETFEYRNFRVYGTGHEFELGHMKYLGTFQMSDSYLIWHLFEVL